MIRWLLLAALAFLLIAALQGVMASRREKKPADGNDVLPALPPLPDATELEKSRRELEALEQRLDIPSPGQPGKGV
jgi:glycerate-2-kinase